jgi:hypothetical protein
MLFGELGRTGEVIALGLTLGVHILGGFALIYMLVKDSDGGALDWWPREDDDGPPRDPIAPAPLGGGGGLPLPVAEPSPVRLREPGTIADGYPRRERRPVVHPPAPAPREPARSRPSE